MNDDDKVEPLGEPTLIGKDLANPPQSFREAAPGEEVYHFSLKTKIVGCVIAFTAVAVPFGVLILIDALSR